MSIEVFKKHSDGYTEIEGKLREQKAFDYGELAGSYNEVEANTIMRFPYPTASMANFRKVMKNWGLTINKDYIVKGLNMKDKTKSSILLQKKSSRVMTK